MNKEEALKKLDELERKINDEINNLRKINDELKEQLYAEQQRANKLLSEKNELEQKLQGYHELSKALGKIRGESIDVEMVRKIVQEEIMKVGFEPTGIKVSEQTPFINLKISKPFLMLDEGTVEGQIAVMALHGMLPEKFTFGMVVKALDREYSAHPRRNTIQKALDDLVGKYKVLQKGEENHQIIYSLRGDLKSRVKTSEVEAQHNF